MEMWDLMQSPAGGYWLWLCDLKSESDKSIVIEISNETASEIISKTGCKVSEIPF